MDKNLDEYADPVDYDLEYGQCTEQEEKFFKELASNANGPVLDLACGTGRMTIPLAKKKFDVTGMDICSNMLEHAKRKAVALGISIRWIHKDCRNFQLGRKFHLIIMTGNAFQAMLTTDDQMKLLACVKDHLHPDGLFVFDTRNPDLNELTKSSLEEHWHTYTNASGNSTYVSGYHSYDALLQIATYTTIRKIENAIGNSSVRTTEIKLRYTFPQELMLLLYCSGFQLLKRYGGYDKQQFSGKQNQMINICSLRHL